MIAAITSPNTVSETIENNLCMGSPITDIADRYSQIHKHKGVS